MRRGILAAIFLCACSASALSHSALQRSDPAANSVLKESPNELRMWFTEPIKVSLSTFAVRDSAGNQIDKGDLRADAKEPALLRLSLAPRLTPGIYRVTWSAVAKDLHVGKGGFSFRIASP